MRFRRIVSGPGLVRLNAGDPNMVTNLSYIDPRHFGAWDDTGVIDCAATLQAAMTAGSALKKCIWITPGIYKISSQVSLPDGSWLEMNLQQGATLDFRTATTIPAREACIQIGSHETVGAAPDGVTALANLGADVAKGAQTFTLASAPTLAPGELIFLVDNDDYSFNANLNGTGGNDDRPYYHTGDYCRVRSVSGTTVNVDRPLLDAYTAADPTECFKVTTNYARIYGGGTIICPGLGTFDGGIHLQNGYRSKIEGITILGARYGAIEFWRCYECEINHVNTATWNPAGNEGSGVFMISCHDCWVNGGTLRNGKHGVSLTGGATYRSIPNSFCGARGATLKSDNGAADMHGHCHHCGWYDCIIDGQVTIGGNHATIQGCKVFTGADFFDIGGGGQDLKGLGIRLREAKGASHTIKDCELVIEQTLVDARAIDLDNFGNVLGGAFVIQNLTVRSTVAQTALVAYFSTETSDTIDVLIEGFVYEGPGKAPTASIHCATGEFKTFKINGSKGISWQCDGAKARLIEYRNVECIGGETYGALLGVAEWAGVTQVLKAIDCHFERNDETGLRIDAGSTSRDVYALVQDCTILNNAQALGGVGSNATAMKVTNLKHLKHKDNVYGDTQAVTTHSGLLALDTITTISGSGNESIGSHFSYGPSATARSIASITNDLETFERREFPTYIQTTDLEVQELFMALGDGLHGLVEVASGAGAGATHLAAPTTRIGVVQLSTGTTTSGANGFHGANGGWQAIKLGGGRHRIRWDISIPTLSTVGEKFYVIAGLDDSSVGGSSDSVQFIYSDDGAGGGNWNCQTNAAGSTTSVDSTVVVATGNISAGTGTAYVLEIEINAAATQALFYINGTLRATITTNIPTANPTNPVCTILKNAGTTARTLQVDTYRYQFHPITGQ